MKYSEYLKLVKLNLREYGVITVAPRTSYICHANEEVGRLSREHQARLKKAVDSLMQELRIAADMPRLETYPAALALANGLDWESTGDDFRWRQKVRHELLDKWIAEAEQEQEEPDAHA